MPIDWAQPLPHTSQKHTWVHSRVPQVKKGMQGIDCILYEKKGKGDGA